MDVEANNNWDYEKIPWDSINAEVKGEILKNKLKKRHKEVNNIMFKKRLKNVDPNEKEQKFIDACMKLSDKDNIDEYKAIFNTIWKDGIDEEKVNFFYDIISQYDTKVKRIKIPQIFYFDDIYLYCFNPKLNTMFFSVDNLYWKFMYSVNLKEIIKNININNYNSFWDDSTLYKDLESIRIISEVISIKSKFETGYFHDYSKDYYLGDVFSLEISKEQFMTMISNTSPNNFSCRGVKYQVYIFDLKKYEFIKLEYRDWKTCVFICIDDKDKLNEAINSIDKLITFFPERGLDDTNEMKKGMKLVKLNNKINFFYFNAKFKPVNFCPSCIKFNNLVSYNIFYKCSIDFESFFNRCIEFKKLIFPNSSIYFDNLESIFNICLIFIFICKINKNNNEEYLGKLKEMLLIYTRNRSIFEMTNSVYKKFKKMILEYIDGLSNNFYYSRYVKLYKLSNELIIEYKKIITYYYEGSDVLKYVNYWENAGKSMQNFLNKKILDIITGVNNVCYQIVNFISKDVAQYLRTVGVLCYSVLFDGYISCIPDVRPHCIFMGGLENSKSKNDIFDKIAILVDAKKHRDEISKRDEVNNFKKVEFVSNVAKNRYKNAIRKAIEDNDMKNLTINDINKIVMIIKNIEDINNYVLDEVNEILKDKYVLKFEKTNDILSNYPLDDNINEAITTIVTYIDENFDNFDKMLDDTSDEFADVESTVYDQIEKILEKNNLNTQTNGMVRKGEIEKIINELKKIDLNKLKNANQSKRIKRKIKKIKKNENNENK